MVNVAHDMRVRLEYDMPRVDGPLDLAVNDDVGDTIVGRGSVVHSWVGETDGLACGYRSKADLPFLVERPAGFRNRDAPRAQAFS